MEFAVSSCSASHVLRLEACTSTSLGLGCLFFEVLHLYLFYMHACILGYRGAGMGAGVWLCEYHGMQVRVRGQLAGVSLHLPPWELQGLDSGHQAWWQAS